MNNKKICYVVPLSGGLDSTYLLYKLLQEKNDIFVLHISIKKNGEYYWEYEEKAVRNIIRWCRVHCKAGNIIDFQYLSVDMKGFPYGYDVDTVCLYLQKYVRSITYTQPYTDIRIAFGAIGDDDPHIYDRISLNLTENLWNSLVDSLKSVCKKENVDKINRKVFRPLYDPIKLYKHDIINLLPIDLLSYVWVCRTPNRVNNSFCGRCDSCKQFYNALLLNEKYDIYKKIHDRRSSF